MSTLPLHRLPPSLPTLRRLAAFTLATAISPALLGGCAAEDPEGRDAPVSFGEPGADDEHGNSGGDEAVAPTADTATLVFVNASEWRSFDWLTVWECGNPYGDAWGFEIDGWLDPGETWQLTGVPTDTCFEVELWNWNLDFGYRFGGAHYPAGTVELVVHD